jgi:threonine synthase
MSFARALRCRECGNEYPLVAQHVCEFCFGPVEVVYDYDAIARTTSRARIAAGPASMWRYADFLPCDAESRIEMHTGFTPLVRSRNLAEVLGLRELYLKNDTVNPTWSFKDRVVGVAASRARELGFTTLACASTGNLANSVAAHAARAGLESFVFIPADLETGKVLCSAIYRPTLVAVDGNYDQVNRLCAELGDKYPWAFVNINVRPYYSEGSKTLAYETIEQLGWRAPDHCVVPIASGSLFTKIYKGFKEFAAAGLVDGVHTRMSGAQAEGCSPVATAWAGCGKVKPVKPNTIARSLAIGSPADGANAIKVANRGGGRIEAVTDEEIVEAIGLLARTTGYFTETAGGVTIATLVKLARAGQLDPDLTTVAYLTGDGLKTPDAALDFVAPVRIEADIDAVDEALAAGGVRV